MVLYLKLMVLLSSMQVLAFLPGIAGALLFLLLGDDGSEMDSGKRPSKKFSGAASVYINGTSILLEAQCCDFHIAKLTCVYHLSDSLGSKPAVPSSFSAASVS